jgi:cytochrome P450
MRQLGPVIRARLPPFRTVWLTTTHAGAHDLLRDHRRFVTSPATAGNRVMSAIIRWLPRALQPLSTNMLLRDEPDHRRLRHLVERAFRVRSVEALRPRLEALADEAADGLQREASRAAHGIDLLAHFARPFPLAVICELLGLPPEDRPKFTRWAARFSTASSFLGIVGFLHGMAKTMRYLRQEIARQTDHPRDGLLAALIQAEEAGDRLTEDELVAMVFSPPRRRPRDHPAPDHRQRAAAARPPGAAPHADRRLDAGGVRRAGAAPISVVRADLQAAVRS